EIEPRSIGPSVSDAGVTVTFPLLSTASTVTVRATRSQFEITSRTHAVRHCPTWLIQSPRGCGIQHGGGIRQQLFVMRSRPLRSESPRLGTSSPVTDLMKSDPKEISALMRSLSAAETPSN